MYNSTFFLFLPEIIIVFMACFLCIADLFIEKSKKVILYYLCQFCLIFSFFSLLFLWPSERTYLFSGSIVLDNICIVLKLIIIFVMFIIFLYTRVYTVSLDLFVGEFFVLSLFCTLGMMIMVSSANFLSLYLGLELLALPLYSLIALSKRYTFAFEASMKYFVMGSLSTAFLLLGISLIYGISGSINFSEVSLLIIEQGLSTNILIQFGLVFILCGVGFKFGAVPFHMWLPDIYQGSPTSITMIISTVPKVAALGMAYRILLDVFGYMSYEWELLIVFMAVLSLFIGNIVAIAQSNIKRMLAYSTIGHVGFIYLGLVSGMGDGYISVMFYVIVYVIMLLGIFGCIISVTQKRFEFVEFSDLKGLGINNPFFGFIIILLLFSMAGVPPTIGFYSKFLILKELIHLGYFNLSIFAVIMSVIGAFYYLRVIKIIFFDKPDSVVKIDYCMTNTGLFILALNGFSVLILGVFPSPILVMCQHILY